jgi:hypothetical protein
MDLEIKWRCYVSQAHYPDVIQRIPQPLTWSLPSRFECWKRPLEQRQPDLWKTVAPTNG